MNVNNLLKRNIITRRNYNFVSRNRKSLVHIQGSGYRARLALIRSIGTITVVHDGRQGFIYCESRRIILFNSRGVLRPESHRRGYNGRRRHRYLSLNFLNESLRAYVNQCAARTRIFVKLHERCIYVSSARLRTIRRFML